MIPTQCATCYSGRKNREVWEAIGSTLKIDWREGFSGGDYPSRVFEGQVEWVLRRKTFPTGRSKCKDVLL